MEKQRLVELVLSAQRRDSSAVSELFNEFYNDVYYIALRETKDPDVSNDITQETFIKVIQNIESIKDPSVFVSWLKTIAYNESKRYYSKKDVKHEVLVDENENGQTLFDEIKEDYRDFIPDEALDTVDLRETVMSFIDELPQAQKTAFIMYYIDDFSVNEIAEIQGVSAGTVKSRLNYSRKSVIESVNSYEKKHKIKLHSIPFLPMLKWLFENAKPTMPTETVATIAESVSSATGTAIATSSATASLTATTGIVAKIASLPIWAKVTAIIVATTVTVSGVLGVVIHNNNKQEAAQTTGITQKTSQATTKEYIKPITEDEVEKIYRDTLDYFVKNWYGLSSREVPYGEWYESQADVINIDGVAYMPWKDYSTYQEAFDELNKYFTEDATNEFLTNIGATEKDGKLYVHCYEGIGGPLNENHTTITKTNEKIYQIDVVEDIDGTVIDEYTINCVYENGKWLLDNADLYGFCKNAY